MNASSNFPTPQQAFRAMIDAGAVFTVRLRVDALGFSFTYRVDNGGDPEVCRQILTAVKARPAPFFDAFKAQVQVAAATTERGTP